MRLAHARTPPRSGGWRGGLGRKAEWERRKGSDVRKMRLRVGKGGGEMNVKVRTDESERGLDRESGRGRFEITYIPFLVTPG